MCAMSRLSLGDIDELARLQRKILSRSASINRLLLGVRGANEHQGLTLGLVERFIEVIRQA
jgi:hypothetical protein